MVDKSLANENLQSFIEFNCKYVSWASSPPSNAAETQDMRGIGLTSFTLSLLILEKNEWVSRLFLAANDISWVSSFSMNCIWKVKKKGRIHSLLCRLSRLCKLSTMNDYPEWGFGWGHWCNRSTFVGLTLSRAPDRTVSLPFLCLPGSESSCVQILICGVPRHPHS